MAKSKSMCIGCRNNPYNHGLGGASGCWSYKTAKIVKRKAVPTWMPPPFDMPSEKVLSCFHKDGYTMVNPDCLEKNGFWKKGFFG